MEINFKMTIVNILTYSFIFLSDRKKISSVINRSKNKDEQMRCSTEFMELSANGKFIMSHRMWLCIHDGLDSTSMNMIISVGRKPSCALDDVRCALSWTP